MKQVSDNSLSRVDQISSSSLALAQYRQHYRPFSSWCQQCVRPMCSFLFWRIRLQKILGFSVIFRWRFWSWSEDIRLLENISYISSSFADTHRHVFENGEDTVYFDKETSVRQLKHERSNIVSFTQTGVHWSLMNWSWSWFWVLCMCARRRHLR